MKHFALFVQLVRKFLEELQVFAPQVAIQSAVVDVHALVQVAHGQVNQGVDVSRALVRIDEHVVKQVSADDGPLVVANDRNHRSTARKLIERSIQRTAYTAVTREEQPRWVDLGQHAATIRRELVGLRKVRRHERRLWIRLHDHDRQRHR